VATTPAPASGPKVPGRPVEKAGKGELSKPVGKSEAKPAPKPTLKLDAKASKSAAPASKSKTQPDSKPESKADSKADSKGGSKPGSKASKDSADGGGTSPASKLPAKPAAKPAAKKKGPIDLATAKSVAAVAAASVADPSGYVLINGRRVRMISTKGLPAPKRAKAVVEVEAERPEPQVAAIKTKLVKKELDEYKTRLLQKRRELVGMLSNMEDEALRSSGGNLSNMPLHMADVGTDTFDQDFTLGMAETERQLLGEIDQALQRIEDKSYGVCQLTGKPIPKTRLEAKPWAKHTIEAAKLLERGAAYPSNGSGGAAYLRA
jgi:RNA polymerase-binding protein DksA